MLTRGSNVVNGQLVNGPTVESYLPMSYAPVAPAGLWAAMGPVNVPPVAQAAVAGTSTPTRGSSPMPVSWQGPASPAGWLHPTRYPVTVAILFLLIGIFFLRYVHWGG